ncbi:proton-coupled amino acid transporter-like protein acs isoform X2 [Rhodnius prolixus]
MALPFAIQKGGLATSLIIILLFWIFYPYCILHLVNLKYKIAKAHKKPYLTYPKALYLSFMEGPKFFRHIAKCSRTIVAAMILTYHLINCMAYASYVSFALAKATGWHDDREIIGIYKLLLIPPLIFLTTCIESLHAISPVSLAGNICTLASVIIVFTILFKDGLDVFSAGNVVWFGSINDSMNLITLSMFSLEPLGIYIAIEEYMEKPHLFHGFKGVVTVANIIPAFSYITIGILGSFRFKDVTISKQFPQDKLELSFLVIYAVSIIFSYPLYYYVVIEMFWKVIAKDAEEETIAWVKPLCRMTVNILVVLFGMAAPLLEVIINILHSFLIPLLCLIVPAIMQTIIIYKEKGGEKRSNACKEIVMVIAGLAAFVVKCSVTIMIYLSNS